MTQPQWRALQAWARTSTQAELAASLRASGLVPDAGTWPAEAWPLVEQVLVAMVRKLDLTPRPFVVPAAPWRDAGSTAPALLSPDASPRPGASTPASPPAPGRLEAPVEGRMEDPAQFLKALLSAFSEPAPWLAGHPPHGPPPDQAVPLGADLEEASEEARRAEESLRAGV